MSSLAQQLSTEIADVCDGARDSLVQIRSGGRGSGAGTIWHADGLILTNAHVVAGGSLRVTLRDGREHPAQLLALDRALDVAAIAVDGGGLPTIPPGESRRLQPARRWYSRWAIPGVWSAQQRQASSSA